MGGAIAQLVARDHRDAVAGIVVSATAQHWQDRETQRLWRLMGVTQASLSVAPRATWRTGFRRLRLERAPTAAWFMSELLRHSARDIAEAGRELGRFDSRPWLGSVNVPAASVVTTRDRGVSPAKQRELAAAIGGAVFEAPIDHLEVSARGDHYNPALLRALAAIGGGERIRAA